MGTVGVLRCDVVVLVGIAGEVIKMRCPTDGDHFPVSFADGNLLRFFKFPIEEVVCGLGALAQ